MEGEKPTLRDWHVAINRNFEYFNFQTSFLRKLTYCFLVESTIMEREPFQYKAAQFKTNAVTNRIKSIKWPYQKEQGFGTNYFTFRKFKGTL